MKNYLIFILLTSASLVMSCAKSNTKTDEKDSDTTELQDESKDENSDVLEVVNSWTDAINARDYRMMLNLLGPHVKFYTQIYTPQQCVEEERKALTKTPDFKQYIASGIEILQTGDNSVKASYTIHTSHGGKNKAHEAYLRLDKIDGRWLITAVSDKTTDLNVARRSANIPKDALAGDFNGDGNTEYLWIKADYDDEGYAVTPLRLVSDAGFIPELEWSKGGMGVMLDNLGSLDGSGRDFLGAIPYSLSNWCVYEVYFLKDGQWHEAVDPFTIFTGDDDVTKRVNRVKGKPGYVNIIYNMMDGEDFGNHTRTVRLK